MYSTNRQVIYNKLINLNQYKIKNYAKKKLKLSKLSNVFFKKYKKI